MPVAGVVRKPDGTPLVGARVVLTYGFGGRPRLQSLGLRNGEVQFVQDKGVITTDADGRFRILREPDPAGKVYAVVVLHPDYFAEAPAAAFEADPAITARPWGRIEGTIRVGGAPAPGSAVRAFGNRLYNSDVASISDEGETQADAAGHFVLDHVVPGEVRVARGVGSATERKGWSNGVLVEVRAAATTQVEVGGRGRPVIARVAVPEGFDPAANYTVHSEFEIESDRPSIPYPRDLLARRDGAMSTWAKGWWASAEGLEYRRNWFHFGQAKLQPDGTIRADDVPPGDYRLKLTFSADPIYGRNGSVERIAFATRQFVVPPIAGGRTDIPLDLGTLRPRPKEVFKAGQPAPGFDVEGLDGGRVRLGDYRGRFVLLDFWATWCGPCVAEIPELKAVQERFGKDERFAMIGLSLDADREAARRFAAGRGLPGRQGWLGDWSGTDLADGYRVDTIPAAFLIGPDGEIRASGLRGDAILPAVERALREG